MANRPIRIGHGVAAVVEESGGFCAGGRSVQRFRDGDAGRRVRLRFTSTRCTRFHCALLTRGPRDSFQPRERVPADNARSGLQRLKVHDYVRGVTSTNGRTCTPRSLVPSSAGAHHRCCRVTADWQRSRRSDGPSATARDGVVAVQFGLQPGCRSRAEAHPRQATRPTPCLSSTSDPSVEFLPRGISSRLPVLMKRPTAIPAGRRGNIETAGCRSADELGDDPAEASAVPM
jgi:hypothetical protein